MNTLNKTKTHRIFLEYGEKEYWKLKLKSMRWDKISRFWYVNEQDFNTFLRIKGDNV